MQALNGKKGFAVGVEMALALRQEPEFHAVRVFDSTRIVVVMGDGECDEGHLGNEITKLFKW